MTLLTIWSSTIVTITVLLLFSPSLTLSESQGDDDYSEFLNTLYSKDHAERNAYFERWKKTKVNIAIMGQAAVGKSTFINKIRGVNKTMAGYAKVGVGGTTVKPTPYRIPVNPNIVFWDTPGIGTPDFQLSDELLASWEVEKYDFILIFYATSIHMSEIELAKALQRRGKQLAFVRTKIDELRHEDHDKSFAENMVIIRKDGNTVLRQNGIGDDIPLFLVSNRYQEIGDFKSMVNHILDSLESIKLESLLRSLGSLSEDVIKRKKDILLNDVWKVCLAVGTVNGLPLQHFGADFAIYILLLEYHVYSYLTIFKLDRESVDALPTEVKNSLETSLKISSMGLMAYLTKEIAKHFASSTGKAAAAKVAESVIEMIPFVGPLITGSAGYGFCASYLESLINELAEEALYVYHNQMYKEFSQMPRFEKKDEL